MQRDGGSARHREPDPRRARARIFVVRVWREEALGGMEYRGSVRDVHDGAFQHFRDWRVLTTFMLACLDEDSGVPEGPEGARQ